MGQRGEVYSVKIPSTNENRTYFLNLKENRKGELYIAVVESKRHEAEFERHQVVVFEEDFDRFQRGVNRLFEVIKEHQTHT
ncbi:MAG: DUF3276 family protein [Spirochaetales bacterium]